MKTDNMENGKNAAVIIAMIITSAYFAVSTIGRARLDKEEIEATRLHIEVLRLQLEQFQSNSLDDSR